MQKAHLIIDNGLKKAIAERQEKNERVMLREFLISQLKNLYWAEKHLLTALPKMKEAASTQLLMQVFSNHIEVTRKQVTKLEKIFSLLEGNAESQKSHELFNLANDANGMTGDTPDGTSNRYVGLSLAGQRAEHYEIASYGSLAQLARTIGETEAALYLEELLNEEKEADDALAELAAKGTTQRSVEENEKEEMKIIHNSKID